MNRYILKCSTGFATEDHCSDIIESEEPLTDSELFEEAQCFMNENIEAWYEVLEGGIARDKNGDPL